MPDKDFVKKYLEDFSELSKPNTAIVDKIIQVKENKPTNITKIADDLRELNKLKEEGILTEEEFLEQKRNIL